MSTDYSLAQIAYWVAYRVLPRYAFQALDKAVEIWTKSPVSTGPFFYVMACRIAKIEPIPEDGRMFLASSGVLDQFDYYLMDYPAPPPVDLSDTDPLTLIQQGGGLILAPHFSVILRHQTTGEVRYYILGQSPMSEGTTFRSITESGANTNLGPGPSPDRRQFLDRVKAALAA